MSGVIEAAVFLTFEAGAEFDDVFFVGFEISSGSVGIARLAFEAGDCSEVVTFLFRVAARPA